MSGKVNGEALDTKSPSKEAGDIIYWKFGASKNFDAYHPSSGAIRKVFILVALLLSAVVGFIYIIDQFLIRGFCILPIAFALYYFVFCTIHLWFQCNWTIWWTTRRGLTFESRNIVVTSRESQIAKLKARLEQSKAKVSGYRPKILCVAGYGGGGHEATLNGVRAVMNEAGFWSEVVDIPVGFLLETSKNNPLWNLTGVTGEQIYNWGLYRSPLIAYIITWGTSVGQVIGLRIDGICGLIGDLLSIDYGDESAKLCERIWKEHQPDMICNFTSGTTEFMIRGLERAGMTHIPLVTIVSDFEGRPNRKQPWIEDKRQYAVCGTSVCRQQALSFGLPPNQVFQTSGMILRPAFYEPQDDELDLSGKLKKLGLDPERRTCLIFWGGVASNRVKEIGMAITQASEKLNIIFLCGRNLQLAQDLKKIEWPCKVHVEGFTTRVSYFMKLSDMIVCKPGPGVCSEAALLGVPILVEWSCFTLPQEVAVCKWVLLRGLGLGFTNPRQLVWQVDRMCSLLNEPEAKKLLRPLPVVEKGLSGVDLNPAENVAVFEVPSILQDVLDLYAMKRDASK
uniref:Monogalactosyldiacylglycerol synthase n=1 Tax=Guillardia theta TaxID=55529 RepID=A0A7S4M0J3_GUITH|mmetsp:Transcript_11679/g.40369  ORF Transcript_11679/g.40369 Transcript_11679/m.40369 type:complete len:565 (+) Transcript_11679:374-2068(+)